MKHFVSSAIAAIIFSSVVAPAFAQDRPTPIAPPKTMGDEGKLPATGAVSGATPEMGATDPVDVGPSKRMGDEGKLPATKGMSGATPQMNAAPPTTPPAE